MATGWVERDDGWYFLNRDGPLLTSGWPPDHCWVDDDGRWDDDRNDRDDRDDDNDDRDAANDDRDDD